MTIYSMHQEALNEISMTAKIDIEQQKAQDDLINIQKLVAGEIANLHFAGVIYPDSIDDLIYSKDLLYIYQRQLETGLTCMLSITDLITIRSTIIKLSEIIDIRKNNTFEIQIIVTNIYNNMVNYNDWTVERLKNKAVEMRRNIKLISEHKECIALLFAIEKRLQDFIF